METEKKEQAKVELAAEKGDLNEQETSLDSELRATKADAEGRVGKVDAKIAPAASRLTFLQNKIGQWQIDVAAEEGNIATWLNAADNSPNRFEFDRAMAQVRVHEIARGTALNGLAAAQNQAATANNELNRLQAERKGIVDEYNSSAGSIQRRLREIAGRKNRIAGDEKKADQPATGITTGTTSLANRAIGFATYEDFPFEQERKRLVNLIK
ncbi:MAG: hypothetical protein QM811_09725 [Pirellulales bacterium]